MKGMRIICLGKTGHALLAGVLAGAICTSCSDDYDEGHAESALIGFAVTAIQGGENETTRAETGKKAGEKVSVDIAANILPTVKITAIEGAADDDGKALYLHTQTTEGIDTEGGGQDDEWNRHRQKSTTTKATPVNTVTMHADATVFAAAYPKANSWNGNIRLNYFYDTRITKTGGWSTVHRWPGVHMRMAFFAYAPHHCTGVKLVSLATTPGAPTFSYTVPTDVKTQADLLTATATDVAGNSNKPAPLTFRHVLTAVRFETGNAMKPGTVTKITLKGVYGTATHRIGETAWSGLAGIKDFAQTMNVNTPDPNVAGKEITPPAATFMMIPQKLPAGAKIEVVYKDKLSGTPRTLTANIGGSTWPMGKTVTYRISTNSIVSVSTLVVTPPADFTYQGGSNSYTVTSYATVSGGGVTKNTPVAWTAEYSTDGGAHWTTTKPTWLTAFTASGAGGEAPSFFNATVQPQVKLGGSVNLHTLSLQGAAVKTNWNLSNATGGDAVQNTANCYLVNAPGTYRLPLVYGNAIKNSTPNKDAYTSKAKDNLHLVLKTFINHRGVGITDPYIYNNKECIPDNAILVWQDEENLVTNIGLSADKHYLTFKVDKATIRQGNAVVAVRNKSKTILWSWHIWVTDYKLGTGLKTITNFQTKRYTIMPINLGWCNGKEEEAYAERIVQVRFKQKPMAGYTPAATQMFAVKQNAHSVSTSLGNSTYYQWGRKDPFVGALEGDINKIWYDSDGNIKLGFNDIPTRQFGSNDTNIAESIKSPGTLTYPRLVDPEDGENKYYNLWSANNAVDTPNDNPVVKTIYDPCPVGYKLPPGNVFTGFTLMGTGTTNDSWFNMQGTFDNGATFYCGLRKTGDTVFFPALGCRIADSGWPTRIGKLAGYWTAAPANTYSAYNLFVEPHRVLPLNAPERSICFTVRPIQE